MSPCASARGASNALREAGAAKARFPQGGHDAILINTGGGLAGGDNFRFDIERGPRRAPRRHDAGR